MDIDSQLPIRSIQDADERVQTKIMDYADPTGTDKQAAVSDNALHVKTQGQQVGGGTNTLLLSELGAVVIDGLHDATNNTDPSNFGLIGHSRAAAPTDVEQVFRITSANPDADGIDPTTVFALDTVGYLYGWSGSAWDRLEQTAGSLNVNITNPITVNLDGIYDVGTNPTPDSAGSIHHTRATTPDATNQTLRSTGATASSDNVTPGTVWGIDTNSFMMGFDGTNWDRLRTAGTGTGVLAVGVNDATGTPFSQTNPLPVTLTDNPGLDVYSPKLASAIAGGASDNHDYTVTALKTLHLNQVTGSSSGRAKMVVSIETGVATGVFTPIEYQFNSTATPNMDLSLNTPISVAAGVKVRVVMSNRESAPQDLASTIYGYEV